MTGPLVSIGLPTFNRAHLLSQALESLGEQSYPHIEIVVSDNCSTDNSEEICSKIADRFPFIRYVRLPQPVPVMQNFRNALSESRGELFMWASDDDLWDKDFVSRIAQELIKDPYASLVAAEAQYRLADGTLLEFFPEGSFWYESNSNVTQRLINVIRHNYGNLIYGIFRRDVLLTEKGTVLDNLRFINEIPLFLHAAARGRIRVIPNVMLYKTTTIPTYLQAAREYSFEPSIEPARDVQVSNGPKFGEIIRATRSILLYHWRAARDILAALHRTGVPFPVKLRVGIEAVYRLVAHFIKITVGWAVKDLISSR